MNVLLFVIVLFVLFVITLVVTNQDVVSKHKTQTNLDNQAKRQDTDIAKDATPEHIVSETGEIESTRKISVNDIIPHVINRTRPTVSNSLAGV